jgi:hypothetical protein
MPDPATLRNGPAAPGPRALSVTAERGYGFRAQNARIADKLYQAADISRHRGLIHSASPPIAGPRIR